MPGEELVTIGVEAFKAAERSGLLQKLRDALRRKHRILVLGSTGAGKTQFLRSITDVFTPALSQAARTEFAKTHQLEINKELFHFVDTPGPEGHKSRRLKALRDTISKGLDGVINIVSYGYHEYGEVRDRVFEDGSQVVRADYLQANREQEQRLLAEWVPVVGDTWITTVITKADIWWDSKEDVTKHYEEGDYFSTLEEINSAAEHVVRPYSSVHTMFYDTVPSSGYFDDNQRRACRNELFRALIEAVTRNDIQ